MEKKKIETIIGNESKEFFIKSKLENKYGADFDNPISSKDIGEEEVTEEDYIDEE